MPTQAVVAVEQMPFRLIGLNPFYQDLELGQGSKTTRYKRVAGPLSKKLAAGQIVTFQHTPRPHLCGPLFTDYGFVVSGAFCNKTLRQVFLSPFIMYHYSHNRYAVWEKVKIPRPPYKPSAWAEPLPLP